ncbi:MAG: DUF4384 domain-containing protein [Acidobacteria bacterium]|nr:DUF4384 domain-containing protein [Acidobacteriota bacterium]MCZ6769317.1 DUF4384 domain-containing protein [Acidobacteriota bacterium]
MTMNLMMSNRCQRRPGNDPCLLFVRRSSARETAGLVVLLCCWASPLAQQEEGVYQSAKGLFHAGYLAPPPQPQAQSTPAEAQPAEAQSTPTEARVPILNTNLSQLQEYMGIRYRITQLLEDCEQVPVDANSTFYAGDQIRLSLESNTDGYLYILNQGTSGSWNYIFPHLTINSGDNFIRKGVEYTIPPRSWLRFDETPGDDVLIILLSKIRLDPFESGIIRQQRASPQRPLTAEIISELNDHIKTRALVFAEEYAPVQHQMVDKPQIQNVYAVNLNPDSYFVTQLVLRHLPSADR